MTLIETYHRAWIAYRDAQEEMKRAREQEAKTWEAVARAWQMVKAELPNGVYSITERVGSNGNVIVVGSEHCPKPMRIMEEREKVTRD